jgi:hypothetical protein
LDRSGDSKAVGQMLKGFKHSSSSNYGL